MDELIASVRRVIVRGAPDGSARVVDDAPSPHVHTLPGMPRDLGLTDLWYTPGTSTTTSGGRHAWSNRSAAPALLASVSVSTSAPVA